MPWQMHLVKMSNGYHGLSRSRESSMPSPWIAALMPPRQGLHLVLLTSLTCVQH